MTVAVIVTLLFVCAYSLMILLLVYGLRNLPGISLQPIREIQPLTVIIPFRNESDHLTGLVSDLAAQHYQAGKFEVIFINDHSEDGSDELLAPLIQEKNHFSCLDLPSGKTGKKEAIAYGLANARTDWIIQTDADCRLKPQFISTHMSHRELYSPDLVSGMVTVREQKNGFLRAFETLDLLSLVGSGAGSFHYHRPMMCNGANLGYSRNLYLESRRFDPSGSVASGDDMFTLIGARKLFKKLSFMPDFEGMVETAPVNGWSDLIRQRIRWGSKTTKYKMRDIQVMALIVVITNVLVFISPLWPMGFHLPWIYFFLALLLKTGVDFLMLWSMTKITRQRAILWWFIPVSIIYYIYLFVILFGSLLFRTSWKGRKNSY